MEVLFEIPIDIKKGLESGVYKRIGGVIVKSEGKAEIVTWLKEIPKAKASSGTLLVKVTSLGKAALSAADYFYLYENFQRINKKLDDITLKIDSQNFSKVQSGLKLAAEAEKMKDIFLAKDQILKARTLLEEGSNRLQNIFASINKKEKNYKEKRMHYLSTIIQAELGIVRSYMWHNEYELANVRLLHLKRYLIENCLKQIDDEINFHVAWYWKVIVSPIMVSVIIPQTISSLVYDVITNKEIKGIPLNEELRRLEKSNLEEEAKLEAMLIKVEEENYKLSKEVQTLINFDDFLKGYTLELDYYEAEHNKSEKLP
ncbi:hypothetical protein [Planomicrobium okeanokoites]|uniref:Uncharacterized protein n=1 Tax=Planomicrobium okeanokoites TaxID=244 RepID=A0ABV7KMV2_PLAOK|nr:hypothetical protein [Planomicrobium okeanokoites]TAA66731.1 hypothetical protein D2910_14560 [Planomicrobium okeanokoites]